MQEKHIINRCVKCKTLNKIQVARIKENPKCGNCGQIFVFPDKPIDIGAHNFQEQVLEEPTLTLVDFWAPWCGYCLKMNPLLERLAMENKGLVKVTKVNTQTETSLAQQFGIQGIPALFLFRNGEKLSEKMGALSYQQLLEWVLSYL